MRLYPFMLILLAFITDAIALEQHAKLWLAANAQQTLTCDKKWHSFIYGQFRFISRHDAWQAFLLEGGLGYQVMTDQTAWIGYRYTGHNPFHGFDQENRLFQQVIWVKRPTQLHWLAFRARLEEIERDGQWGLRFRPRVALELKTPIFTSKIFPFFYDEPFFQLRSTDYSPNRFFSENRLLVGINLYAGKESWWEVGYLNQYIMATPQRPENQMNHILSLTYNV